MKKLITLVLFLAAMISAQAAETVIATLNVSGTSTGNWANTLEISGDQFFAARSGDVLRLTFTTEEGAQLQLCVNLPSWANIVECFDVTDESSPYSLTLTDEQLASIKADKLYIQGKFVTIVKAELVRIDSSSETVLATLTPSATETGEWATTIEVQGSEFTKANAQAGDIVRLTFSTAEGSQLQLCANTTDWSWYNILPSKDVTAADSPYDLTLDAATLTNIEADKLYIQGKYISLSKAELVRNTATSILSLQTASLKNQNSDTVYSLSGIAQSGKLQRGIYIKGGRKFVVK